ncbi:hypothetical protein B5K06_29950 [Rhizobium grahamii]|uniref:Uncharacterized protein n=2 Tax=Rhizobium grahamii TaxID=1120045 RepID=S3HED1_9HYPH|nr:hypothetical protein RGCCGE502_19810 [Rhizobium grahamii CCGE 502]RDJ03228.1 hypothetical protein B5K06_29950 [Rhizobium grahamii]
MTRLVSRSAWRAFSYALVTGKCYAIESWLETWVSDAKFARHYVKEPLSKRMKRPGWQLVFESQERAPS